MNPHSSGESRTSGPASKPSQHGSPKLSLGADTNTPKDSERRTDTPAEWLEQAKYLPTDTHFDVFETVEVPRNAAPELVALAEIISRRAQQLGVIEDMPRAAEEHLYVKFLLGTLTEFINEARDIRRSLAVRFINDGGISRKQAGEILGVHQATVGQWVKEDTPQQAENTID